MLVPVHVIGELVAGLLYRFEEGREQRARGRPAFEHERAVGPPVLVTTGEAGLHAFEVGETMRIVPIRHTRIGRPPLIIKWVAALEDHPVDAARPAEDLPASVIDPPPAHVRFRLGLVLPVVEAVPDGHGQGRRHVDQDVPAVVEATGLEDQYLIGSDRPSADSRAHFPLSRLRR